MALITFVNWLCTLCAFLYALIATNASDLQHSLDVFYQYCNKRKIKINANKTKIIMFNGNGNDYKKV